MEKLFLQIINMSITSTYVILCIIIARLFLKKAPKIFSYILWSIAFFRLVFPFSIESIFSIISINTKTIPENIVYTSTPQIQSGIKMIDVPINEVLPKLPIETTTSIEAIVPVEKVNPIQILISIGTIIWLLGIIVLISYSLITTFKLSTRLKTAKHYYGNVYITDSISTPFVFGLIKPKIFLPNSITKAEEPYIIKHEEIHIKRNDHIIKFLAFIVLSIHWFNPAVWLAFHLMVEDMEKSCDESVIKELGYSIKKDYSYSLLALSTGKRKVVGSPIAFGENSTKSRIKNVLNYKKPKFWVILVAVIAIIVLAVGLLTNPPKEISTVEENKVSTENENNNIDENYIDKTNISKEVEKFAWQYIDKQIEAFENVQGKDFKVVDKEITRLERVATIEDILSTPVEIWELKYRLKLENMEGLVLAGGMNVEDGWLIDDGPVGKPFLAFTYKDGNLVFLGNINSLEYDAISPELLELSIRGELENKGILPNETYEGNHVVIRFPLSTGETGQLLLSQPVVQGDSGMWTVERWMDGNGNTYLSYLGIDKDMTIKDYYRNLQIESDHGTKAWLTNPVEVGYDYIINNLGQILVKKDDLVVINPATIYDFYETPESHYIGYITKMTLEDRIFHLDRVEFINLDDKERISELNLNVDYDMPNGYYIYNTDNYPLSLEVSDSTQYLVLNWDNLTEHKSLIKKEFIEYNKSIEYNPLYNVYTKDGFVTRIVEQYLP